MRSCGGRRRWVRRTCMTCTPHFRSGALYLIPNIRRLEFAKFLGDDGKGSTAVPREWQANPDPRRRMGPRHDVAPEPEETSGRIPICSGYEPERDTARGQDRKRRILLTRRSKRNSYHGGLVLLRPLGKVGRVEGGPVGSWVGFGTKPELAPSCPPKPADVVERKRQAATGRR